MNDPATQPTNPFDDETGSFLVLRNPEGAHSLWPGFLAVPRGWDVLGEPAGREACLERIEALWRHALQPAATGPSANSPA